MTICKYGCGEEITWIDGKPYSLQNHYKVCRPGEPPKAHKSDAQYRQETDAFLVLRGEPLLIPAKEAKAMIDAAVKANPKCLESVEVLVSAALNVRDQAMQKSGAVKGGKE